MTVRRALATAPLLWMISVALSCADQHANARTQDRPLKDWALSRCLAKANSGERGGDDAAKSAAAYLEMSKVRIDVYEKLDGLVDSYLRRTYSGSVKSNYNTMKCIDLYQSNELQALTNQALDHR